MDCVASTPRALNIIEVLGKCLLVLNRLFDNIRGKVQVFNSFTWITKPDVIHSKFKDFPCLLAIAYKTPDLF